MNYILNLAKKMCHQSRHKNKVYSMWMVQISANWLITNILTNNIIKSKKKINIFKYISKHLKSVLKLYYIVLKISYCDNSNA